MHKSLFLTLLMLVVSAPASFAQQSARDATAQQTERTASPTTRTDTRPTAAVTRPALLKEARRIVFLVDTRVGLWPVFQAMREELGLAVRNLREDQFFTIIALRPLSPSIFNQNAIRADPGAKRAAADFVAAIEEQKTTNPVPGIAKAVELEPDLMCLIVGDDFPQTDAVRRAFRPFHGRLNVFLFTPLMPHSNEFLRNLALEHQGKAMDQRGNELEPPKPAVVKTRKPESRPSVFER